jgi:hypothetical protein
MSVSIRTLTMHGAYDMGRAWQVTTGELHAPMLHRLNV